MELFGQLTLEGIGTLGQEKKAKAEKKVKASDVYSAPGQKKNVEQKWAVPLDDDVVIEKGRLICPPLVIEFENMSVIQLRQLLEERGFLEAEYFGMFAFDGIVIAALPVNNEKRDTVVSSDGRIIRFGDSMCMPDDGESYTVGDLLERFTEMYPEYKDASVIKLAEDVYAPLPAKFKFRNDLKVALGDSLYDIPDDAADFAAALSGIECFEKVIDDDFSLQVLPTVVEGNLHPYFFYVPKSSTSSVGKTGNKKESKKEKTVILPVKLAFTFGVSPVVLTSEDFGGDSKISMSKIKELVEEKYSALKDVNTDFCYMRNVPVAGSDQTEDIIQVLVHMQGKGAFFPVFDTLEEAAFFVNGGGGDAARFFSSEGIMSGKVQKVPAGTFIHHPDQRLEFTLKKKIPESILRELICLFRLAMPLEDAARVYVRNDGTFFVHHLTPVQQSEIFVNFADSDQPNEALEGRAFLFCEVHSHNYMPAFFSEQDIRSAVYPGLYVCIGKLDKTDVEVICCAQMDWESVQLRVQDVFDIDSGRGN